MPHCCGKVDTLEQPSWPVPHRLPVYNRQNRTLSTMALNIILRCVISVDSHSSRMYVYFSVAANIQLKIIEKYIKTVGFRAHNFLCNAKYSK